MDYDGHLHMRATCGTTYRGGLTWGDVVAGLPEEGEGRGLLIDKSGDAALALADLDERAGPKVTLYMQAVDVTPACRPRVWRDSCHEQMAYINEQGQRPRWRAVLRRQVWQES